ncbi:lytic transglycosylase domain-containing protein [Pseudomarimonas salicorniae]|uniref:Lytic transglycosylase domain-containing protein n=1 Tax=Pseudomarimonas salicorniae TaxID=2933270 RepID=A0ABT0GDF4_9GAMM|nr:lytic transglycosylase domain-containing protein [Lysobacter sp. CAU 1642]MCK7592570.1 lytic transglycosylase domain-containing protein [Lysobacter sp. CAU 1642]
MRVLNWAGAVLLAGLTGLALPAPAAAASLFRCTGPNGEIAFTSSRVGYSNCRAIHVPEPVPAPRSATPAATPPGGSQAKVEFRSAPAGAEPATPVAATAPDRTTRGAVYRYVKDGVTHYTNRRPAGVKAAVVFTYIESCFACSVRPGLDFHSVALNRDAFSEEVLAAAARHGVDPAFVRAVIHAESAFNPMALSNKGAQGLMQLMPATADRFGVLDAFTPAQNIEGGTRYLAWLLKRFNGDTRLAAAGYNSGEGNVDRYGGVPPFEETQRFVERVGILHARYGAGGGAPVAAAAASSAGPN